METHKNIENQHSVKIGINAKGQFIGECKCYGQTPEEALSKTCKLANSLEALIKEKNA